MTVEAVGGLEGRSDTELLRRGVVDIPKLYASFVALLQRALVVVIMVDASGRQLSWMHRRQYYERGRAEIFSSKPPNIISSKASQTSSVLNSEYAREKRQSNVLNSDNEQSATEARRNQYGAGSQTRHS